MKFVWRLPATLVVAAVILAVDRCCRPVRSFVVVAVVPSPSSPSRSTASAAASGPLQAAAAAADRSSSGDEDGVGLYRRFSDHALERLRGSGLFDESAGVVADVPRRLRSNRSEKTGRRGGGESSLVRIENFAMGPAGGGCDADAVVRYARVTLLETIGLPRPPDDDDDGAGAGGRTSRDDEPATTTTTHTGGIQVLNFIIVPSAGTDLPVLGIDLVRLPGGKDLLLLDAQPMADPNPHQDHWKEWHARHVVRGDDPIFSWGGDFPPPVRQYVSPYALWTRLQPPAEDAEGSWDPTAIIQNEVWDAFTSHLDIYLDLLKEQKRRGKGEAKSNNQAGYLEYRRTTDPAKPMLNALFGPEWTQEALDQVLFPTWMD